MHGLAYRIVNPRLPVAERRLAILGFVFVAVVLVSLTRTSAWVFLAALIFAFVAVVGYDVYRQRRFRTAAIEFIDVFLGNGLCPACLYRLAESPPDESGLVCCTECGAHWRGRRIRKPEVGLGIAERDIAEFAWGRRALWKRRPIEDHAGVQHDVRELPELGIS